MHINKHTRMIPGVFTVCTLAVVFTAGNAFSVDPGKPALTIPATPAVTADTVADMQAALTAESNAKEQYTAWAKKADAEGYRKIAQLFRAAAKSEEIHSAHYANAIKERGGNAALKTEKPVVKSTKENLAQALKNETEAATKTYSIYLAHAKNANNKYGAMAFGSAMAIYSGRKAIYEDAIKNLPSWKKAVKGFMVCTVCGNLVERLTSTICPVCKEPASKFTLVS